MNELQRLMQIEKNHHINKVCDNIQNNKEIMDSFKPLLAQQITNDVNGVKPIINQKMQEKAAKMQQAIENDFKTLFSNYNDIDDLEVEEILDFTNLINDKQLKRQPLNQNELDKINKAIIKYNTKNKQNFQYNPSVEFFLAQQNQDDLPYLEKLELLCGIVSNFDGDQNDLEEYVKTTFNLYVDFVKKCKAFYKDSPNLQNRILNEFKHIRPFLSLSQNSDRCLMDLNFRPNKAPLLAKYIQTLNAFADKDSGLELYAKNQLPKKGWSFDTTSFKEFQKQLYKNVEDFSKNKVNRITQDEVDDIKKSLVRMTYLPDLQQADIYPRYLKQVGVVEEKIANLLIQTVKKDESYFIREYSEIAKDIFVEKTRRFDYGKIYNDPNLTDDQKKIEVEKQNNKMWQESYTETLEQYNPSQEYYKHSRMMRLFSPPVMTKFLQSIRQLYPNDEDGYVKHLIQFYNFVIGHPFNVFDINQKGEIAFTPYFIAKFGDIQMRNINKNFVSADISYKIDEHYLQSISDDELEEVLNNLHTLTTDQLMELDNNCDNIIASFADIKHEYATSNKKKFTKLVEFQNQKREFEEHLKGNGGPLVALNAQMQQLDADIANPANAANIQNLRRDKKNLQARIAEEKDAINRRLQKIIQKLNFDKNELIRQRILHKEKQLEKIKKRIAEYELLQDSPNKFKQKWKISEDNKFFEQFAQISSPVNVASLLTTSTFSNAANNVIQLFYKKPSHARNDTTFESKKNNKAKFLNPLNANKQEDEDEISQILKTQNRHKNALNNLFFGLSILGGSIIATALFATLSPFILFIIFASCSGIALIASVISAVKKGDSPIWNMLFKASSILLSLFLALTFLVWPIFGTTALAIIVAASTFVGMQLLSTMVNFISFYRENDHAKKEQIKRDIISLIPFYGLYKSYKYKQQFATKPNSDEYKQESSRFLMSLLSTLAILVVILLIILFALLKTNILVDFNFKLVYAIGAGIGALAMGTKSLSTIFGFSGKARNKKIDLAINKAITPAIHEQLNIDAKRLIKQCGYQNPDALSMIEIGHPFYKAFFIQVSDIYSKCGFSVVSPLKKISKFNVTDEGMRMRHIELSIKYAQEQIKKKFVFRNEKQEDAQKNDAKQKALQQYYQILYLLQLSMPYDQAFHILKKYAEYASFNPQNVPGFLSALQINYKNTAEFILVHNLVEYLKNILNPNPKGVDTPDIMFYEANVELTDQQSARKKSFNPIRAFTNNLLMSLVTLFVMGMIVALFMSAAMFIALSAFLVIFGIAGFVQKLYAEDKIKNEKDQRSEEIVGGIFKLSFTVFTTIFTLAKFGAISVPVIASIGVVGYVIMAVLGVFAFLFIAIDYIQDVREHEKDRVVSVNAQIAESITQDKKQKTDIQLGQNIKLEFNDIDPEKKQIEEKLREDLQEEAQSIGDICNAIKASKDTEFIIPQSYKSIYAPYAQKKGFEAVYKNIDEDDQNKSDVENEVFNKSFAMDEELLRSDEILESMEDRLNSSGINDSSQSLLDEDDVSMESSELLEDFNNSQELDNLSDISSSTARSF